MILETKNLIVGYNRNDPVLENINISILRGEMLALTGPNGAGKSSFIKTLCSFLKPISGEIIYHPKKNNFSLVPQVKNLQMQYPLNAEEVLRLPLEAKAFWKKYKFTDKEEEIIEKTGVALFREKLIRECSGGQIQKLLICRSLISQANLIFLDEPLDALDAHSQREIFTLLAQKVSEGVSFFVITHNISEEWLANFHKILKIENKGFVPTDGKHH